MGVRDQYESNRPDPVIGRTVAGRYLVESVLGEGGFALVYRAEHVPLRRAVALKMLHRIYGEHEELNARFQLEAKALRSISHPHIVHLLDHGLDEQGPFIVMELLEGETLGELLGREGALPYERARSIIRQLLRALVYAHENHFAHRDLKPANLFLQRLADTPDHVKVLDFGFAKFLSPDEGVGDRPVTTAGTAFGTPAYMAPEQVTGGPLDGLVDLYATGVLFFEMLAGRRPFEGEGHAILRAKVAGPAPRLSETLELEVAPELDQLLATALALRGARFQSARAMLEAVNALPERGVWGGRAGAAAWRAAGSALRAKRAASGWPEPGSSRGDGARRRALWAGGIVAALVLALALAFLATTALPSDPHEPAAMIASDSWVKPPSAKVASPGAGPPSRPEPDVVARYRALIEQGADIDGPGLEVLRRFAHDHPQDPTPGLLLGHIYVARGWRTDALASYESAFGRDPAIVEDRRLLANLLSMSAHGAVAPRAWLLVERAYGSSALTAVEAILAAPELSAPQRVKLQGLRARLAALEP